MTSERKEGEGGQEIPQICGQRRGGGQKIPKSCGLHLWKPLICFRVLSVLHLLHLLDGAAHLVGGRVGRGVVDGGDEVLLQLLDVIDVGHHGIDGVLEAIV